MALDESKMREMLKGILDEIFEDKLANILPAILEVQLAPIRDSLNFISSGFDEMKGRVECLEKQNKFLVKETKELRIDVGNLQKELCDTRSQLDEQEQYSRRECLELRGIPCTPDENTDDIVQSVASLLDVDIDEKDISVSHRIPLKKEGVDAATLTNSVPAIIVKFTNRNTRDRLYKARSSLKDFDISDIGLGRFGENNIYIQENLTAKKRKLFKKTLEFRKEYKFKFIWTKYGSIYLRKNANSPAIRISCVEDLEKMSQSNR